MAAAAPAAGVAASRRAHGAPSAATLGSTMHAPSQLLALPHGLRTLCAAAASGSSQHAPGEPAAKGSTDQGAALLAAELPLSRPMGRVEEGGLAGLLSEQLPGSEEALLSEQLADSAEEWEGELQYFDVPSPSLPPPQQHDRSPLPSRGGSGSGGGEGASGGWLAGSEGKEFKDALQGVPPDVAVDLLAVS